MKKQVTLIVSVLAILCFYSNGLAQKVKIKNEVASLDGVPYVKVITKTAASEISIYELNENEELVYMSYHQYDDPTKATSGNPRGTVRWVKIQFLTLSLNCEVPSRFPKKMIKLLYENNVFVEGKLSEENAKKFVEKYGTKFSENKPETVIIYNR